MAAFSFLTNDAGGPTLIGKLSKSRFFAISVALHFVIVLLGGSVVLFKAVTQTENVEEAAGGLVNAASNEPPAPQVQPQTMPADPTQEPTTAVNTPTAASLTAITSMNSNAAFALPSTTLEPPSPGKLLSDAAPSNPNTSTQPKVGAIPMAVAKGMKGFTGSWAKGGEAGSGVNKSRSFKFTAYLAKYAGGDWDSTIEMSGGKIAKGSLPNLLYLMRKWSRDKIDATPDGVPLDLSSEEIFAIKPPFILFTGHRDFVLTDKEVDNLRKYLQLGGCIWGDSSLPGNRSRFDLAFPREMKRILTDQDINWETLPPDHPIYTKTYYPEIRKTPPGLNYYEEPVYALKNYGEVVVVYTANDYCDMWRIALDERGKYDLRRDDHFRYLVTNETLYFRRDNYFRNLDEDSLVNSYKFGTNIILHLLTRWEDKLRNVPTGL